MKKADILKKPKWQGMRTVALAWANKELNPTNNHMGLEAHPSPVEPSYKLQL